MSRLPTPIGPLLRSTAVILLPTAVALGLLVVFDGLSPGGAVIAAVVLGVVFAVMARPHIAGITGIATRLDAATRGEEGSYPSPAWPPLVAELASAVARARRRWQQRVEEMAARVAALDAVLDGLPDPLIMLDGRLRIVRANAAAKELFGDHQIAGRELSVVLRVPAVLEAAQAVLRRGSGLRAEFELATPVKRHFSARVERLAGRTGDDVAAILVLHDLTTTKRTDQMRADFVANASHELRTPLATLLGFIETLQGPASQDPRARERFLGIMQQQANRMSRLVDDLLSLSRIELHEHTPPTEPVNVADLLHGVADALQPQSRARDMVIRLEPTPADLPPVLGDADELAQVFQNLIDNALKYGRRGSEVRVEFGWVDQAPVATSGRPPLGGHVAVAVIDQGEGIPADRIPRLTERFYRVDAARSRELGGTGLGLAIVKHIVNRHRGALHIQSEIGQGSRFTVYLPLAAPPRRPEEVETDKARGSHGTVTQS